ncbi:Transcriptional activator spt7 [Pyrenophora tritici-repentis]|nr:Transcriptional activator spt7 [Pyrenophora tritici-repentis]KAI0578941.1 Transcriptional activator spt7 [Pyrenophora tritici-repentis]KAI0581851.1 Transcriptional activator spt7 [Pyrenophora tritici-repentis]KAI0607991.1 Transcriptional activator spt7 [Pyrenophora tritici-repentis]KAI0620323.1 Transcriptional activator spt7 [Pyrenophora tritici-repentis]
MSLAASPYPPSSRERPSHARFLHQPPNATRLRTPNAPLNDEAMSNASNANHLADGADTTADEDPRAARWRELYLRTETRLAAVLGGTYEDDAVDSGHDRTGTPSSDVVKTSDDVRKKLQQDKKAAEDAAKRTFHTLFYTLESDRDAMLEQQKLDELDRQVEIETSGAPANAPTNGVVAAPQQGTLSTTNLGASSLTLKHLISRIDAQRDRVHATDAQLRSLISEVRKNRSKWANEDRVGQEELYESTEKVLMELKANEHAHPFLQRVNKREAPDYYNVIKHPMDIGTMMKKLKQLQYKSKKEFVDDLMLIWANCLKYNADPSHFLRKKALHMKKETEKLVPLIPDITVRDRAEVEAEERRMRNGDADADGADDSEDEEPIMASRGRKAPSKGGKGSSNARKAPPAGLEDTPGPESKPPVPSLNNAVSNLKNEFLRADSEMEGSVNGFSTPPPGTSTPLGPSSISRNGLHGSQADASDVDGTGISVSDTLDEDADLDDMEYKTWKQVTKKDRAIIASERHRLFRDDHLQPDEPAILRTKAGMRRWLRHRKQAMEQDSASGAVLAPDGKDGVQATAGESLAEGIEGEEERQIPDYYDPVCAIPDLSDRLQWVEDAQGHVIPQAEEYMRIFPKGQFISPDSALVHKFDDNNHTLQETRKICAKIGIVKQMQLQSQLYQNQFQRYEPQPFMEADIEPMVTSEDGPIMAPYVCRAALQRSVGKIFYHAGFEEFQPSALDAVTDIAAKFFQNLVASLGIYRETPKMKSEVPITLPNGQLTTWAPRFTQEEAVLHSLHANGVDLESLETYVKDDVERLGTKLGGMHDRMRSYYAELLRPAMDNAGADGAGAFNDGSEQFVGGDFAEDIGEDFFGFKELGLDIEFGLTSSVPLHLLQNRVHNAYARQDNNNVATTGIIMPEPPKFEPVTLQTAENQIGLLQGWLYRKLQDNNSQPLVEDDELPPKQRFPKPRLPPTGKISSPRKRPIREQQQMARKKRKLDEAMDENGNDHGSYMKGIGKPVGKLKLEPTQKETRSLQEPEKDDGSAHGMPSPPESF